MDHLKNLKKIKSINQFAQLIGFEAKYLSYILYKIPINEKYYEFTLQKKCGGERVISSPEKRLKLLQRRLSNLLNNCIQDIKSRKQTKNPLSHGFIKKADSDEKNKPKIIGIHSNARCHRNKRYVINFDLEDFFSSFNFGRVRGFFIKNNDFKLNPNIATLIAQIACHQNKLPQGSPCSPIITNLITHILDVRLALWAKKYNCYYSRYVDDITFSTNKKIIPPELATQLAEKNQWEIGNEIKTIIKNFHGDLV